MDQKLSLSTHILDTSKGQPADDIEVKLFKLVNEAWVESKTVAKTNKDGRVKEFTKVDGSVNGIYKLRFEVASYFQRLSLESLYPFIEVSLTTDLFLLSSTRKRRKKKLFIFQISFTIASESHYHIPLLLNPFGYSTYRGS